MRSKFKIVATAVFLSALLLVWQLFIYINGIYRTNSSSRADAKENYYNSTATTSVESTSKVITKHAAEASVGDKSVAENKKSGVNAEKEANTEQSVKAETDTKKSAQAELTDEKSSSGNGQPNPIITSEVSQKASSIARKEVEMQDYSKAAGVILGKLSLSEIKFIFDTARDDFWVVTPVEEIERVRNIIFSKLDASDLATLTEMGKKYGRSMTILEPNINVAEVKAKQVAAKQAKK